MRRQGARWATAWTAADRILSVDRCCIVLGAGEAHAPSWVILGHGMAGQRHAGRHDCRHHEHRQRLAAGHDCDEQRDGDLDGQTGERFGDQVGVRKLAGGEAGQLTDPVRRGLGDHCEVHQREESAESPTEQPAHRADGGSSEYEAQGVVRPRAREHVKTRSHGDDHER